MALLKITEAAARLGVTARTIRFYEQKGLLAPQKLPHNGYRLYTEQDLLRLRTILSLREAGLTLAHLQNVMETYGMNEREELTYLLELQRSLLYAERLNLEGQIRMNEDLIHTLADHPPAHLNTLFEQAEAARKQREIRSNWKDHYRFDEQAPGFDTMVVNNSLQYPGYSESLQQLADTINPQPGETGLDLGTGTGNLAALLQRNGAILSGVDQSRQMLMLCRRKLPWMETKLGNLLAIPYFEASFDFVGSSYVLHLLHGDEQRAALGEIRRVLKPLGQFCTACPLPMSDPAWTPLLDRLQQLGFTAKLLPLSTTEDGALLTASRKL